MLSPFRFSKSELFIVTNIIAWTYLLHAHYRKKKIEYRRRKPGSEPFQRTKNGAIYHWSLEECLDCADCPLDDIVKKNIRFLIGARLDQRHASVSQSPVRATGPERAALRSSGVVFTRRRSRLGAPRRSS